MSSVMNALRMNAAVTQNTKYFTQLGIIAAYDTSRHMAQVILQTSFEDDPQLQTGWLRISTQMISNSWSIYSSPSYGTMCEVTFQEGNINTGIITSFLNTPSQLPANVPQGEHWLVHSSGASIKLQKDGNATVNIPVITVNCTDAQINASGKIDIESQSDMKIKSQTKIDIDAPMVNIGDTHTIPTTLLPLVKQGGAPAVNVKGS